TTSTQALLLINGGWTLARARALAARIDRGAPDSAAAERIIRAYRLTLGRSPEPDEFAEALAFLDRQSRLTHRAGPSADYAALVDFCHVLLNSNEFLYLD